MTAVAAHQLAAVTGFGIDVNRAADQTYRGHLGLAIDARAIALVQAKELLAQGQVDHGHARKLSLGRLGDVLLVADDGDVVRVQDVLAAQVET
jgi:hypothetical protein